MSLVRAITIAATATLLVAACAHTATQPGERADLQHQARITLARMEAKDPTLKPLIDHAAGYIVFPVVGDAGFLVGGGAGKGILFENGQVVHFAELTHLNAGALAGGSKYAEIVVVRDPEVVNQMRDGRFDFGARASAVIIRTGAGAGTTFEHGVAVFVDPLSGAMVNASVSGQKIRLTL